MARVGTVARPGKSAAPARATPPIGVRGYRIRDLKRTEERKREILLGAARAFARRGYHATNMESIAHECGLAKGHIYHYFRSKEEIFTEIRTDAVARLVERLSALAVDAAKDPESAIRKAIALVVARSFEEGGRYEATLREPESLSGGNRIRIRAMGRRFEQIFIGIMRSGIEKGIFVSGDPKLMSFVVLRGAFTVTDWYREGGKWKPQWIIEQVTEQLIRSVRNPRYPR
ncbi:MAG TPA: TetR/AcrR family transcriptional regulator [Candidatus Binataceae bacterium]|nr:TetR/AcrR family transcriptional regulator [Candidatus Binataceae bacterium]